MVKRMIQSFLKNYSDAVCLDDNEFDQFFDSGTKRADFSLYEGLVICECKEIVELFVAKSAERLARKNVASKVNFKRDFYNSIRKTLSYSNAQILETKKALSAPHALGLVIVENLMPSDISVLTLIDAANEKMRDGLESVDGILCLDSVNTFIGNAGEVFHLIQLVMRDTERSNRLSHLVDKLEKDFAKYNNASIFQGHDVSTADQKWLLDEDDRYKKYEAVIKLKDK